MKKILIILMVFLMAFSACQKLEDLNKNTKDFTAVPGPGIYNGAIRSLLNQLYTFNVNNNNTQLYMQYFAETTYPDESRYDMVTRPIPAAHMNALYRTVLMNFKDASAVLTAAPLAGIDAKQRKNQLAIIEIMAVYTWSNIVETFGDMPYTDALDFTKPSPKYDDAFTIYKALVTRLDAALANMDPAFGGMGAGFDNIYGGGVAGTAKWIRFANTLKMRMGLVLADKDPALSKTIVDAAEPKAFIAGDKCALTYLSASPNQNPVYTEVVVSGRFDFVVTSTLTDPMNALNDPRRDLYLWTKVDGAYKGGAQGMPNSYASYTHLDNTLLTPTREVVVMDYAEAEFLRAEAAARGNYAVTDAATHYNNAIKASITSWGGTAAQADTYLAQPAVAYATATGTWQQKIGEQAYYAYYMRGFTSWLTWRRLDYPRLKAASKHVAEVNGIPVRYSYPVSEQTLNGANYKAAAAAIGGDNALTKLFWDKASYDTLN
jgi:hypothetical protein